MTNFQIEIDKKWVILTPLNYLLSGVTKHFNIIRGGMCWELSTSPWQHKDMYPMSVSVTSDYSPRNRGGYVIDHMTEIRGV